MEALYDAIGEYDLYAIVDMPDDVSLVAASLAVNASGSTTVKSTVLMSAEDLDAAAKKVPAYSPPGT